MRLSKKRGLISCCGSRRNAQTLWPSIWTRWPGAQSIQPVTPRRSRPSEVARRISLCSSPPPRSRQVREAPMLQLSSILRLR